MTNEKEYHLYREPRGHPVVDQKVVVEVSDGVKRRALRAGPSQKLWNHSPDGFEWGYGGSGPAQLALAILLDVTDNADVSVKWHQDFKRDFIAGMPRQGGSIWEKDVMEWLLKQEEVVFNDQR